MAVFVSSCVSSVGIWVGVVTIYLFPLPPSPSFFTPHRIPHHTHVTSSPHHIFTLPPHHLVTSSPHHLVTSSPHHLLFSSSSSSHHPRTSTSTSSSPRPHCDLALNLASSHLDLVLSLSHLLSPYTLEYSLSWTLYSSLSGPVL